MLSPPALLLALAVAQASVAAAGPAPVPAFGAVARGPVLALDDYSGDARVEAVLVAGGETLALERDRDDAWRARPLGGAADAAVIGDFDADGAADIAGVTPAGVSLHTAVAQAGESGRLLPFPEGGPAKVHDALAADLDGDGRAEVFVAGAPASRWWQIGTERLTPLAAQPPLPEILSAALADLDADGRRELVVLDSGGAVRIAGAHGDGPDAATGVQAFSLADVDDDGDADLLTVGPAAGEGGSAWRLLRNDRASGFREVASGPAQAAAVVDYDNDGRQDVVALGPDAVLRVVRQVRRLRFAAPAGVATVPPTTDRLFIADLDRDGFADVVASGLDAPVQVANGGADQRWLGFDLHGQTADAGRAAMVEIVRRDGGRRLRAVFGAGSTVIGLGRMAQIDVIAVYWPSGRVTRLQADRFDRYLDVHEPGSDPKGRRAVGVPQRFYRDHALECR